MAVIKEKDGMVWDSLLYSPLHTPRKHYRAAFNPVFSRVDRIISLLARPLKNIYFLSELGKLIIFLHCYFKDHRLRPF